MSERIEREPAEQESGPLLRLGGCLLASLLLGLSAGVWLGGVYFAMRLAAWAAEQCFG